MELVALLSHFGPIDHRTISQVLDYQHMSAGKEWISPSILGELIDYSRSSSAVAELAMKPSRGYLSTFSVLGSNKVILSISK
jgi:hypothetical protein